ncbi:sorting nexin-7 [Pseudoliparis swirei]|uniref:sorting nexin-7 n=1 Tax=Pseudoliparis swirei TaxID=2059687 RepID=UPI0024BEB53E|nr:sorting nexin-7 [Pseudoliparis swirei]
MSGHTVPVDFSGHMLDLDEDEDLEVFSKDVSLADGAPVPNSPSSMANQYGAEEEEEEGEEQQQEGGADEKDIFITVDNPESHVTAIETFIMYRVETKTTRGEFDSSEYEVLRRYQDFAWLRSKLEEAHPTLIVQPLPEKFVMKGMVERFNQDFIERRRRALERFLRKTSEHHVLTHSQSLKAFLTAQDLLPHKKQGPGFLSRMGDTVRAAAHAVRGLKSRPEEFCLMQDYVEDFSNKICSVDKVTQRIIKEQREYLEELKQYSPAYAQWAESEEKLAGPLNGVAGCVERCSTESDRQIQHLSEVLVPALHEYVLYTETLKAVMRRRDNIQAEFEAKNLALASRRTDQEALQEEVDGLAGRVEMANNALRGDWTRWRSGMRADLRSAFLSTAEKNVDYYEQCLAVWESFLLSQRVEPREQRDGEDIQI